MERVIKRLNAIPDVRVLSVSDRILSHSGGKIRVEVLPLTTRNVLSMIYTPGVGRVSQAIAQDRSKAYALTTKCNSVAIVTDGSGRFKDRQFRARRGRHGRQIQASRSLPTSTRGRFALAPRTPTKSCGLCRVSRRVSAGSILRISAPLGASRSSGI